MNKQYVVQIFRFVQESGGKAWVTMTPRLTYKDAQSLQKDFERDNMKDSYRVAMQGEGTFKAEEVLK